MRLVNLSVQSFQCIESADLDFGPGLNVLYGPNDLGKSSLVSAIRAVLLLQHSSSMHEPFVSWHGAGEPRVALTFADAEDRYWRVAKVFGQTKGRSTLDSSKDGRSFTSEATGRQVDDKLRKLLGWGIGAPGGKGAPRGMPDSFLIQVLVAEQDTIRKVMQDASLADDSDPSGRARLTAALGALAQDPTFKRILDRAQAQQDKAFKANGSERSSAASPFVEISDRIKRLASDHEALTARIRETSLAETRIHTLSDHLHVLVQALDDARAGLDAAEQRRTREHQRAMLRDQLAHHRGVVAGAAAHEQEIANAQHAQQEMEQEELVSAQRRTAAAAALLQADAATAEARRQSDELTRGDSAATRLRAQLELARQQVERELHEAGRTSEQTTEALRQARDVADQLVDDIRQQEAAATEAAKTGDAYDAAARDLERAREGVNAAVQRLHEATSSNQVRERELRRVELVNRQLTRQAERTQCVADAQRAADAMSAHRAIETANQAHATAMHDRDVVIEAVQAENAKISALHVERDAVLAQERLAHLRRETASLTEATRKAQAAQQARDEAAQLRADAAELQAQLDPALPTRAAIGELRELRDQLRLAESRLAVGLSVTLRPRRPFVLHSTTDDATRSAEEIGQPVELAAEHRILLRIDDVVELEIEAGAAESRAEAAQLRSRWSAEGAPILYAHRADSVEELDRLRHDADERQRSIADKLRDATQAEQRAEPLAAAWLAASELPARIAELETELAVLDRKSIEAALDRLGTGWQAAIQRSLAKVEQRRQQVAVALDRVRQQRARSEAHVEVCSRSVDEAQRAAVAHQAAVPDPQAAAGAANMTIGKIDGELAEIERELGAMTTHAGRSEAEARAGLVAVEAAMTLTEQASVRAQQRLQQARDAHVQAATRVDLTRRRASELDRDGRWRDALADASPLPIEAWHQAALAAEQRRQALATTLDQAHAQLEEVARTHRAASDTAATAVADAEAMARSARTNQETLAARAQVLTQAIHDRRLMVANLQTKVAAANIAGSHTAIVDLEARLGSLGADPADMTPDDVEVRQAEVMRLQGELQDTKQELDKASGALEQVGGVVVVERRREIDAALQQARTREQEVRIDYLAWKLLTETMKEAEGAQSAHLGRRLATPVSQRFRALTAARYGDLELGADLESSKIEAAGQLRELSELSAGTQDQLATLYRLCIAEQLHSSIVLDDHLSQSDPERVAWFNAVLRTAANQIQIAYFTCRPSEVLSTAEMPASPENARVAAAGLLRAVDLSRVIRRFASAPGAALPTPALRTFDSPE